jgi:uncharacterized damage-inducible protein DinB
MYRHIDDFVNNWKYESESTLKLFKLLSNEALDKQLSERVRTAGFLAWHITHTLKEMMERTGLTIAGKAQQDYNGETVEEICSQYEQSSNSLLSELAAKWTDADLEQEDEMYGEKWKRGVTLHILITHQAHHRGELVVIMRLLGLPVLGMYGPAYEEWLAYGMEPLK